MDPDQVVMLEDSKTEELGSRSKWPSQDDSLTRRRGEEAVKESSHGEEKRKTRKWEENIGKNRRWIEEEKSQSVKDIQDRRLGEEVDRKRWKEDKGRHHEIDKLQSQEHNRKKNQEQEKGLVEEFGKDRRQNMELERRQDLEQESKKNLKEDSRRGRIADEWRSPAELDRSNRKRWEEGATEENFSQRRSTSHLEKNCSDATRELQPYEVPESKSTKEICREELGKVGLEVGECWRDAVYERKETRELPSYLSQEPDRQQESEINTPRPDLDLMFEAEFPTFSKYLRRTYGQTYQYRTRTPDTTASSTPHRYCCRIRKYFQLFTF